MGQQVHPGLMLHIGLGYRLTNTQHLATEKALLCIPCIIHGSLQPMCGSYPVDKLL